MTTPISMLAIDLAKVSFQLRAIGAEGACVDTPCLASMIFDRLARSPIGRVSGL